MKSPISVGVIFAVLTSVSTQPIPRSRTAFPGRLVDHDLRSFGTGSTGRTRFDSFSNNFEDPRGRSLISFGDSPQFTLGSMRQDFSGLGGNHPSLRGGSSNRLVGETLTQTPPSPRHRQTVGNFGVTSVFQTDPHIPTGSRDRTSHDQFARGSRSHDHSSDRRRPRGRTSRRDLMQDLPVGAIGPDGQFQEGYIGAIGGRDGFPVMGGVGAGEAYADGGLSMGVHNGMGTGSLRAFLERRRTGRADPFAATISMPPPGTPPLPEGIEMLGRRGDSSPPRTMMHDSLSPRHAVPPISSMTPSAHTEHRNERVGARSRFNGSFPGEHFAPAPAPVSRPLMGMSPFGSPPPYEFMGASPMSMRPPGFARFGMDPSIGVGLGTPMVGGFPF